MNDSIKQPNWNLAFAIDSLKHAFQDISGEMERLPGKKELTHSKEKQGDFSTTQTETK